MSNQDRLATDSIKGRPVAVLGGGISGRRIACTWAAAGYTVNLCDPSAEQRHAAIHYVEHNIASYAKENSCTKLGKVIAFADLEPAVEKAWTVIEAIPENIKLKIDIFGDLAKTTQDDCILATNSSSYKSSEMLEKVPENARKRVLNTHYMVPPDNRIVELMTDGYTDSKIVSFYVERLQEAGMSPLVARKESKGFVLNRLQAAIRREVLTILSEGVSVPEELDRVWMEMYAGSNQGPCGMMDAIGLDTVASIEQCYAKERDLTQTQTVDFLQKNYIDQGKLGAKSGKGGFYPAGYTTKTDKSHAELPDKLHAPLLYYLDLGLTSIDDPLHNGKILVSSSTGDNVRTLVTGQMLPDGLDISLKNNRIYWTNMGTPSKNDGCLQSCKLDGSDIQILVKPGDVHTPKQVIIDHEHEKLYFCDREGLRVMRCNLDGSQHETLVERGDWRNEQDMNDMTNWCVGIAVDPKNSKFYWTQKGPSKGGKGRIFRADMNMPSGEDAKNRSDIDTILTDLPEPIDLEVDPEAGKLYWTDRGDPPVGNTINMVLTENLGNVSSVKKNPKYEILARNMHEAIGIKLDIQNQHIYSTDIGGAIYRFNMDGKAKAKVYESENTSFSGITLAFV